MSHAPLRLLRPLTTVTTLPLSLAPAPFSISRQADVAVAFLTAMVAFEPPSNLWVGLFVVRLVYPLLLLLTTFTLLHLKPSSKAGSSSPITAVIVEVKTPRRSLILTLLSLVAFIYFLDGFALVLHSILTKTWQGIPSQGSWIAQWSGLEVEALVGLLASALLAIFGLWKETKGVKVWEKRRVRLWALVAVAGTLVEVVLTCMSVDFLRKRT